MRIQRIEAENFKLFTTKFQDIKDMDISDLILLNGPNGYGKTSIFDVIEFCFTGKIERIEKYNEELGIAKNETYGRKILISDETKQAYVKVCFEEKGKNIEIEYLYSPSTKMKKTFSKENNPHNIFGCFTRKIVCNEQKIDRQEEFLKEMQMNEMEEVFDKCCFLSQDEHLQFLKEAKKSKSESLSFLFDIPDKWEQEKKRVGGLLSSLSDKRKQKDSSYLKRLEEKESELKGKITDLQGVVANINSSTATDEGCKYQKIFDGKSIVWDQENGSLNAETYRNSQQEIDNLIYFAEHKDECECYLFNLLYKGLIKPFDGSQRLSCTDYPLEFSFRFYSLLKHEHELEERYLRETKYRKVMTCIDEKEYEELNWDFVLGENLLEEKDVQIIQQQLESIKVLRTTMGVVEGTISALQSTRKNLIKYAKTLERQAVISGSVCPLCGASYADQEQLKKQIEEEERSLNKLSGASTAQINEMKEKLHTDYFIKLRTETQGRLQNAISDELYEALQTAKKSKAKILNTEKLLNNVGLNLPERYQTEIDQIKTGYDVLLEELKKKLKIIDVEVELQLTDRGFIDAYDRFYDQMEERFSAVSKDMLIRKKEYLKSIYYNINKRKLEEKRHELVKIQERMEKLKRIIAELDHYQQALQDGIQAYKKKIISDIEPLLYVYTAKILQQKFNGKSIFISVDEQMQDIQLVNSIVDGQDILYSMSSGQLSAVALSFLLCMNQVYRKQGICSILLIDDPVQTIDDVNMVGFVDLLRYEFADRQIFVSTHEQKFEWFLRYRYAKANKKVSIFNMKRLMLQENETA